MPFTEHSKLARLFQSRSLMVALATLVVLAVAGTTLGYAARSKSVTLSLDGQAKTVSASGDTVGEVLDAEGVDLGSHDVVAPGLDEEVTDGSQISVRFGRPLELTVDGQTQTHWVTSTKVSSALGEIGRRFAGADLSTSRGGSIDREGLQLKVVTPKTLVVKIGAKKPVKREITALDVRDALRRAPRQGGQAATRSARAWARRCDDGDRIVFTDVRVVTRRDRGPGHRLRHRDPLGLLAARGQEPHGAAPAGPACAT